MGKTTSIIGLIFCIALTLLFGSVLINYYNDYNTGAYWQSFYSSTNGQCFVNGGHQDSNSEACKSVQAKQAESVGSRISLMFLPGILILLAIIGDLTFLNQIVNIEREEKKREDNPVPVIISEKQNSQQNIENKGLNILKERFAKGEITEDEYVNMKKQLEE